LAPPEARAASALDFCETIASVGAHAFWLLALTPPGVYADSLGGHPSPARGGGGSGAGKAHQNDVLPLSRKWERGQGPPPPEPRVGKP